MLLLFALAIPVGLLCADLYHYLNHRFQHRFIHTSLHRGHHTVYNPRVLVTDEYASYDGKGDVEPLNSYVVPACISVVLVISFWLAGNLWAGLIAGSVNFCMRFFYHWFSFLSHTTDQRGFWKWGQQNHFIHHFKPKKNLGDPFFIWDRLLGTFENYEKQIDIKIVPWKPESMIPKELSSD